MKKNKIIMHLDLNYFFCRCEEIINPELENKYFVVANNDNGVVSTSNKLARTKNIKSAMLVSEAKKLCNNLIIVEPHFNLYSDMSKRFFDCLVKNFNQEIEIASIDECFMDVTFLIEKYHNNVDILASEIIKKVYQETKLYVTIGIGNNKFLAKMAGDSKPTNKIAKIFYKDIPEKIWPLKISSVIGVGVKTSKLLNELGIYTVNDFLKFNDQNKLKQLLHKRYTTLLNSFNGYDDFDDIDPHRIEKSISQSRTYNIAIENEYEAKKNLKWLCNEIKIELDKNNYSGNKILVQIKYYDKTKSTKSISKTYYEYFYELKRMQQEVIRLFNDLWNGQKIRLLGVSISNIIDKNNIKTQNHLF